MLMNRFFNRSILIALAAASIAPGCSVYKHYQAAKPENVQKTEAMLTDAGFHTIQIDNSSSEQAGLAANLPTYELRQYAASSGSVYWYYDPDICSCVFEGDQAAFNSYQMAQQQRHDIAEYASQSQDQEVASLNALNGRMFPLPILWLGSGGFYSGFFHGGGIGHGGGGLGGGGRGGGTHIGGGRSTGGGGGGGGHGGGGHGGGHR
jgi:hypothetical protein